MDIKKFKIYFSAIGFLPVIAFVLLAYAQKHLYIFVLSLLMLAYTLIFIGYYIYQLYKMILEKKQKEESFSTELRQLLLTIVYCNIGAFFYLIVYAII